MRKYIIAYTFFLLAFCFFSYAFVDPNLVYLKNLYTGFALERRPIITLVYTLFIIIFFILYIFLLRLIQKKNLELKTLKFVIGITFLILLFSFPSMLSYDIFNYMTTAKVAFHYRENPYIVMPIEFIGEPYLFFTRAANKIALYGPSWITMTAIPHFFGFGNFILTLFSFKIFISLFYLGSTILIFRFSKSLLSVSLFALNPLILIETLISSHNDIAMIFFTLLSFWLLSKKRIAFSLLAILLSILIKYATVFLVPIYLYVLFKIIRRQKIDWDKTFYLSAISMFVVFFLSPFREEMYPWYAIWFLPFISLISNRRLVLYASLSLSFSLLLRYIPFMYWGTYFGQTPIAKIILTTVPSVIMVLILVIRGKLWPKLHDR